MTDAPQAPRSELNALIQEALADEQRLGQDESRQLVDEFNRGYFVLGQLGGKCRVAWLEADAGFHDRRALGTMSYQDFKNWHDNRKIQVGTDGRGNPIMKGVATYWLDHPRRRTYDKVIFDPGRAEEPRVYNLWQGFTPKDPQAGDCRRFLDHVREVICAADDRLYRWYVNQLAYWVQHPAEPGHVAIVQRGTEGTGKNTAADAFGALWGPHYLTVTRAEQLVGRFNKHLLDCCVVHANEAFYAGAKSHAAALKALITDDALQIEPKGVDLIQVKNRVKLFVSSNEAWVVPAGLDSRRFAVFEVSPKRRNDHVYFETLIHESQNGGRGALLHYLQNLDVKGHNPHEAPASEGLDRQRILTLEGAERLWHEILTNGELPEGGRDGERYTVTSNALLQWAMKRSRQDGRLTAAHLGLVLHDNPRGGKPGMGFQRDQARRPRRWLLPSLREARLTWDRSGRPQGEWHADAGWEQDEWAVADDAPF